MCFGFAGLLDDREFLLGFDGLAGSNFNFLESARGGRDDGNLHFHGFHDNHHFVLIDVIANVLFNLQNLAYHRGFNSCRQDDYSFIRNVV